VQVDTKFPCADEMRNRSQEESGRGDMRRGPAQAREDGGVRENGPQASHDIA
jgi:hypothetical protein